MNPELILYLSYVVAVTFGVAIGTVFMYFNAVKPMDKAFKEYKEALKEYEDSLIAYNIKLTELCELQGKMLNIDHL